MKRDTLLLIAILLAAVLANRALAQHDPQPVLAPPAPDAPDGTDEQAESKPRTVPVLPYDGASAPIYPEAPPRPPASERQGQPATVERSEDGIKIFQLENVRPEEVVETVHVLFRGKVTVSAVPSQRMLIARGPEDELRKVEAKLLRLDASPAADKRSDDVEYDEYGIRRSSQKEIDLQRNLGMDEKATDAAVGPVVPGRGAGVFSGDARWNKHVREGRHLSLKGLRAEFEEHDAKAREIAKSKRQLEQSLFKNSVGGYMDMSDLRDAVTKAFDARQTLQRRELAELAEQLAAIQQSLEARERMKDEIINRRVEELLKPELEWESSPEAIAKDSAIEQAIGSARQPTPPPEDGIPLIAAVNAFNRSYTGPDHPYQPPLTEDEVVDAIRNWKHKRNEVAVSDAEFAAFLRIAETRRLPPGYVLAGDIEGTRRDGKNVMVSSVVLHLPTPSRQVRMQDYLIRKTLLDPDTRVPLSESPPSATGEDTQAVQPIGEFDPSRSQSHTFADRVGHVTQVFRGEKELVIRSDTPGKIKKGDILQVSRRPEDDIGQWKRFAEVQVTWVRRDHAGARVVTATPLKVGTYDLWMKSEPGDLVHKPEVEESAVTVPPEEDQSTSRAQSPKNLKQIMLAFQKYHYTFGYLPPAVLSGQENTGRSAHPHSWRVAILPYLGDVEIGRLYNLYRFDEPWDSEHNKSLLGKMPDVYRSPLDAPNSMHASYFAVVTPHLEKNDGGWKRGTLFSNPQGTPIREIHDGTSNTIAVVEAKRAVPWTKPEDIVFHIDGPLPELGGWFADGFHAGFADGSAHFVSKENDAQTLRHLLLIQDGHVVAPKFVK